jgi:hypothetical protein
MGKVLSTPVVKKKSPLPASRQGFVSDSAAGRSTSGGVRGLVEVLGHLRSQNVERLVGRDRPGELADVEGDALAEELVEVDDLAGRRELDLVEVVVAGVNEGDALVGADTVRLLQRRRDVADGQGRAVLHADDALGHRLPVRVEGRQAVVRHAEAVVLAPLRLLDDLRQDGRLAHDCLLLYLYTGSVPPVEPLPHGIVTLAIKKTSDP